MAGFGFIVTRGFGPGASPSNLIARGFIPAVGVVTVVRGAVRRGRRAAEFLGNVVDELKINASLLAINGKELINPIFNTVRASYKNESAPQINVVPTKLVVKQPDIKVKVKQVSKDNVKYRIDD